MGLKRQITEYLDIDMERETWCCNRCGQELISARDNYKKGCLIYERDPRDIHRPLIEGKFNFAPDPEWVKFVEYYCPNCGTMINVEQLPLGHPIIADIEIDVDELKEKHLPR